MHVLCLAISELPQGGKDLLEIGLLLGANDIDNSSSAVLFDATNGRCEIPCCVQARPVAFLDGKRLMVVERNNRFALSVNTGYALCTSVCNEIVQHATVKTFP